MCFHAKSPRLPRRLRLVSRTHISNGANPVRQLWQLPVQIMYSPFLRVPHAGRQVQNLLPASPGMRVVERERPANRCARFVRKRQKDSAR